ncbi:molybdopterin converting factor subunit 1 [Rhizobium paknamense]|uniref:Molybdopterin synthase sulfur carrier subunit n=1 Tax=Rhizobium paknamense TaxID=1206817 RepID=A0ABU0I7D0_9HYPH|nr:molybdopterin converting factor subunit 1 [Rhizobium paknamense]MDQ0454121.1 molybdopterin synthase sulfur carrier subunit [Rhizobium paknamense]
MVKLVYFAWVRERIGKDEEELDLPDTVKTGTDLIAHLTGLGENYAEAFQFPKAIRIAINQEHVDHHEPISDAREIGLFPPMTGG